MIKTQDALQTSPNYMVRSLKPKHEPQNLQEREQPNQELVIEETQIDKEQLEDIVTGLNKTMDAFERTLEFSVHEDTNRIMVKVVDRGRFEDEVIREIPPERILDMVATFMDMIGILVDQRV